MLGIKREERSVVKKLECGDFHRNDGIFENEMGMKSEKFRKYLK